MSTQLSPKEKAKELVDKMKGKQIAALITETNKTVLATESMMKDCAKACAIIAVDVVISQINIIHEKTDPYNTDAIVDLNERCEYLQQVKTEIQSL